ncbi:MAG: CHASE3 domain-containing protein [Pyrinomonadaceae bacterium]
MLDKIRKLFAPVIKLWDKIPLPWQGLITTGLPFVAVFISAMIAFYGNYQRQNIEADVQRKFKMVSAMSGVLNLMVNAETGMRGYLITKRENFLEPYNLAKQNLPGSMSEIRSLAEAEPGEKPRLEKLERINRLQTLIDKQIADLDFQREYRGSPDLSKSDLFEHLDYGKSLMDEIRLILTQMDERESYLLNERISDINQIRKRDYLAVFLVLFLGIVVRVASFYLFRVGILARIVALSENIESAQKDKDFVPQISEKQDELGKLETGVYNLLETAKENQNANR